MEVCCLHTRDVINHSCMLPAIPVQACWWGADPEWLHGPEMPGGNEGRMVQSEPGVSITTVSQCWGKRGDQRWQNLIQQ